MDTKHVLLIYPLAELFHFLWVVSRIVLGAINFGFALLAFCWSLASLLIASLVTSCWVDVQCVTE
jgi:hypothetical protein